MSWENHFATLVDLGVRTYAVTPTVTSGAAVTQILIYWKDPSHQTDPGVGQTGSVCHRINLWIWLCAFPVRRRSRRRQTNSGLGVRTAMVCPGHQRVHRTSLFCQTGLLQNCPRSHFWICWNPVCWRFQMGSDNPASKAHLGRLWRHFWFDAGFACCLGSQSGTLIPHLTSVAADHLDEAGVVWNHCRCHLCRRTQVPCWVAGPAYSVSRRRWAPRCTTVEASEAAEELRVKCRVGSPVLPRPSRGHWCCFWACHSLLLWFAQV